MANLCLMAFLFFNPFGIDLVTYSIMSMVNSYLITVYILYLVSALLFGLSIWFYKKKRKKTATILLGIGTFTNPLGYDIAFAYTMHLWNGSYLKADITFYVISWIFLTLFCVLSNLNPFETIQNKIKNM